MFQKARSFVSFHGRKPERETGGPDPPLPLKIKKNIGFLSNTGTNPLKNHKATKPAFNVGHICDK